LTRRIEKERRRRGEAGGGANLMRRRGPTILTPPRPPSSGYKSAGAETVLPLKSHSTRSSTAYPGGSVQMAG
jgi:hypothetical protein